MKLNKNFVQISLTALITSAVFIIPMANTGTGLFSAGPAPSIRLDTWQQAERMHQDYLDFRPMLVKDPETDDGTIKDLKGFIFEASQLDEIINNNHSGTTPNKVYFMFGREGSFPNGFLHRDRPNMRIIAVGMKDKTLLNTVSEPWEGISVFDKADPCPPNCPE